MRNKNLYKIILILLFFIFKINPTHSEQFEFDVTEIEILNNGNLYKGLNRGKIKSNKGIVIYANTFTYDKKTNEIGNSKDIKILI